ncbi:MAG: hypothetical protein LBC88_02325 [Spirochaetaceae bacterium]|jgi:class 3 adenylate cyclase|nr:hypothetical protein [Spirochaetaceae bacterium]
MAASFSGKKQLIRFLISFALAAGTFFPLAWFLSGPRLAPHYDLLMNHIGALPPAPELTLIETGSVSLNAGQYEEHLLEPSMVTRVILTLAEFDAGALVIHSPVLGVSPLGGPAGADLRGRFEEEFTLIEQNIRNLFQGIRAGSIPPEESERYVDGLVSLSARGRDRLLASLTRKDETGERLMEQASAVFGKVWRAGGIRLPGPLDAPGSGEGAWYVRPVPDGDGVFRRVAPARYGAGPDGETRSAHIMFMALMQKWRRVRFVYSENRSAGSALRRLFPAGPASTERGPERGLYPLRLELDGSGGERIIPLDRRGRVLPLHPRDIPGVRRLPLSLFLDYARVEEEIFTLLEDAENKGYFAYLDPEAWPVILFRYAASLQTELLENSSDDKKFRWLDFRGRWIRNLAAFLDGPSESLLEAGYEALIAREGLDSAGVERVVGMREEMLASFTRLRARYGELAGLRGEFSTALAGAFCVMGTVRKSPQEASGAGARPLPPRGNPTAAEVSVILANTLLTGDAVTPAPFRFIALWSLLSAAVLLLFLKKPPPLFTLIAGSIAFLVTGAAFASSFVFTAYWIDPLLPALSVLAGTLASSVTARCMKLSAARRFREAYRGSLAPHYLRQVIREENPPPGEVRAAKAAIIAVRKETLRLAEMREPPEASAEAFRSFRDTVFRHFTRTGGTFLGAEGDMVFIAYGSPLERVCLNSLKSEIPYEDEERARSNHSPAAKAVGAVMESPGIAGGKGGAWVFGIDAGECVFRWSAHGGYAAFGPPVIRARTLANLTARYDARILVTGNVIEKVDGVLSRKTDILRDRTGAIKEAFYELIVEPSARPAPF